MYSTMMASIATDQIKDMHADAARDQRARVARRARRAEHRAAALRRGNRAPRA